MANYTMISLQINNPGETVKAYIEKRYDRLLEYSKYHCSRAGIPDEANDLLNEICLTVLGKDPEFLEGLYLKKKGQYRDLDFYMLNMIKMNAHSITSPYRHKNRQVPKAGDIEWERVHVLDEVDESEDKAATTLKRFRLIRWAFNGLDLTDLERRVFEYVFFQAEMITEWPGTEGPKKIYDIYNQIVGAIHQILYFYDFTDVTPTSEPTNLYSEKIDRFRKTHKIKIRKSVS
jgi:hypothetical protein